jgi:hypothetical protein
MAAPGWQDFTASYEAEGDHFTLYWQQQVEPPAGVTHKQCRYRRVTEGQWTEGPPILVCPPGDQEQKLLESRIPGYWWVESRWFAGSAAGLPGWWSDPNYGTWPP